MGIFSKYLKKPGRPRKGSEPLKASDWLRGIDRAKEVKKNWQDRFRVLLAEEYYEGASRPPEFTPEEWINLNMIWSTIRAQLPALYATDPYFYVKLAKSYTANPMMILLMEQTGRVRQSMLNYLKREIELKDKGRLAILDSFFSYGLVKVHTRFDLTENPRAGQAVMAGEAPLVDDEGNEFLEPDELPANLAYCVTRVHADDHLVDEDAGPLDENVSWHAQRIRRPLADIQADKRYRKAARDRIKAVEVSGEEKKREQRKKGGLASPKDDKKAADVCVLWEIYDLRRGQWLTVAEGLEDEFLREPGPVPDGVDRHPFVDLRQSLRRDSWYPIPPASQLIDSQREYCESRSYLMRHRKNVSARKYEMDASAFDDQGVEARSQLETGGDGTVLVKSRPTMGSAVTPIQDAPLDQQIHTELAYLKGDFYELSGAGSNQRGSGQGIDSATEAGVVERHAQLQQGDLRSQCAEFLSKIARKLDQQVQANITEDQAVKVAGPQGEFWEMIRAADYEEIAGEYEYTIDFGSTTPQTPDLQRAQLLQLAGMLQGPGALMGLAPRFLRKLLQTFELGDDEIVKELQALAEKIANGMMPGIAQPGSSPGVTDARTMVPSSTGGTAAGIANFRGGVQ